MKFLIVSKFRMGYRIVTVSLLAVLTLLAISTTATAKGKPPKGGNDTATVEITSTGVVMATQECQDALAASSSDILCNKGGHQIMLGDFFVNRNYANGHGRECFGDGIWDDVAIGVWEDNDGSAGAIFRWHAPDTKNVEILYVLEVYGLEWSGDFPPLSPGTITMHGDDWLLRASNKRQSRNACVGEGGFGESETLDVNLTRLD